MSVRIKGPGQDTQQRQSLLGLRNTYRHVDAGNIHFRVGDAFAAKIVETKVTADQEQGCNSNGRQPKWPAIVPNRFVLYATRSYFGRRHF